MPLPHMIEFSSYCDNYSRDDYISIPEAEKSAGIEIKVAELHRQR